MNRQKEKEWIEFVCGIVGFFTICWFGAVGMAWLLSKMIEVIQGILFK